MSEDDPAVGLALPWSAEIAPMTLEGRERVGGGETFGIRCGLDIVREWRFDWMSRICETCAIGVQ